MFEDNVVTEADAEKPERKSERLLSSRDTFKSSTFDQGISTFGQRNALIILTWLFIYNNDL